MWGCMRYLPLVSCRSYIWCTSALPLCGEAAQSSINQVQHKEILTSWVFANFEHFWCLTLPSSSLFLWHYSPSTNFHIPTHNLSCTYNQPHTWGANECESLSYCRWLKYVSPQVWFTAVQCPASCRHYSSPHRRSSAAGNTLTRDEHLIQPNNDISVSLIVFVATFWHEINFVEQFHSVHRNMFRLCFISFLPFHSLSQSVQGTACLFLFTISHH